MKEILFIITCRLNIDMTPVGGMASTTAALLPLASPSPSTSAATPATDNTSGRLAELDKLKSQRLISAGEYKAKRNEILKGL